MTMLKFHGKVIGWSPDVDPEWEFQEDWDEWRPVHNGVLTVLLNPAGEPWTLAQDREHWRIAREFGQTKGEIDGKPIDPEVRRMRGKANVALHVKKPTRVRPTVRAGRKITRDQSRRGAARSAFLSMSTRNGHSAR